MLLLSTLLKEIDESCLVPQVCTHLFSLSLSLSLSHLSFPLYVCVYVRMYACVHAYTCMSACCGTSAHASSLTGVTCSKPISVSGGITA